MAAGYGKRNPMYGKPLSKAVPVIEWVLENLQEPVFYMANETMEETFDIPKKDYDEEKIWLYMLNANTATVPIKHEDSTSRFFYWYRACKNYLPKNLSNKIETNYISDLGYNKMCDKTKEYFAKFNVWYDESLTKIAMHLSQMYYLSGQKKYLDILEKRSRRLWGVDKTGIEVSTKSNNTEETNLTITIKEV